MLRLFYFFCAGYVKRFRRLILVRSMPSRSIANSLALSSSEGGLAPVLLAEGRRNVPSSRRLYQSEKPSPSHCRILIRSLLRPTNRNRLRESGSRSCNG